MTINEEPRIDRLEQALDELREGGSAEQIASTLDDDTAALFAVAARLEEDLPDDLPDPAFRARLAHDLGIAAPPIEIGTRRRRFLYDWRFGVAAAALAAILLMAVIFGTNTLMGDSPEPPARETVVSALSVAKDTAAPGSTETPETVTDTKVFPPVDADHVVTVPLGLGAGGPPSSTPGAQPTPGVTMETSLPVLPETAPTWLLTGPDASEQFLQTLVARTGISGGQIEPAPKDGPNAFVVVDETGFPAIHWNQHDAFFRYDRGPNEPTPPAARATTDPAVTARDWLKEIGFDLVSMKYQESMETSNDQTIVRFVPSDLPATAIAPGLGVSVGVGPDGSIQFAQGFWLSLGESADVPMRTSQEALDAMQNGEWYSTMPESASTPLSMTVSSAEMSYLLTRADDSSFLLEPVVAFHGDRWTSDGEVKDSVYVSAIKK